MLIVEFCAFVVILKIVLGMLPFLNPSSSSRIHSWPITSDIWSSHYSSSSTTDSISLGKIYFMVNGMAFFSKGFCYSFLVGQNPALRAEEQWRWPNTFDFVGEGGSSWLLNGAIVRLFINPFWNIYPSRTGLVWCICFSLSLASWGGWRIEVTVFMVSYGTGFICVWYLYTYFVGILPMDWIWIWDFCFSISCRVWFVGLNFPKKSLYSSLILFPFWEPALVLSSALLNDFDK